LQVEAGGGDLIIDAFLLGGEICHDSYNYV